MDPEFAFWFTLATRMVVTAVFVVFATWAAERAGALVGALVATLPISAAPAYVFLALDHDATFIAATALASLSTNAANMAFCAVYTVVAQSRGLAVSLSAALTAWLGLSVVAPSVVRTLPLAIILNILTFAICLAFVHRFRRAPMPPTERRWYDIPLRAGMVAVLVAVVVGLSSRVGTTVTGVLALFPIVLVSLTLIFQPRIGGPAVAAITTNSVIGLAGYGLALVVLILAALPLGSAAALSLALAVSIGWNLAILIIRSRTSEARVAP